MVSCTMESYVKMATWPLLYLNPGYTPNGKEGTCEASAGCEFKSPHHAHVYFT